MIQAVALTFALLGALLMAHRSGLIKATGDFKFGVVAATGAIFLFDLASFVLSFLGRRLWSPSLVIGSQRRTSESCAAV